MTESGSINPIDVVEEIARDRSWDHDRIDEDQITLTVEGEWGKDYSLTLATHSDGTLRLICAYELLAGECDTGEFYRCLNLVNDQCWAGKFTYWSEENLMVFSYGLILADNQVVEEAQIERILSAAISSCNRFYPVFLQVLYDDGMTAEKAVQSSFKPVMGRA